MIGDSSPRKSFKIKGKLSVCMGVGLDTSLGGAVTILGGGTGGASTKRIPGETTSTKCNNGLADE